MTRTFGAGSTACNFSEEGGCLVIVVKAESKHAALEIKSALMKDLNKIRYTYASRKNMKEL